MKRAYDYFFYSLYRFSQAAPSKWWSEGKAAFVLSSLEVYLLLSIITLTAAVLKRDILPDNKFPLIILVVLLFYGGNYYLYIHKNKWRKIIGGFDSIPKQKKLVYDIICWLVAICILASLFFAFYKMSQVDWASIRNASHY